MPTWSATNTSQAHHGFVDVWQTKNVAKRYVIAPGDGVEIEADEVTSASAYVDVVAVEDDIPRPKEVRARETEVQGA